MRLQQRGTPKVLIVSDISRIARDERDGAQMLDACRFGRASVITPGEDGEPRWVLTQGGSPDEVDAFKDRVADARRFSADIGAKVRKGRRRWAGTSYHGGPRMFGFTRPGVDDPDPAARGPQHGKTMVINEAEAAVIRQAAADLLGGTSVRAVTRGLREAMPPVLTVTGARWNTRSLTGALLKPAVAGLTPKGRPPARGQEDTRPLVPAPWPAILPEPEWRQLKAKLTDQARRTSTSNEPRWLVSVFATCGVCGGLLSVGGAGNGRPPAYVGRDCGHIRREAAKVDHLIGEAVIRWLEKYADSDRLRPPARPDADTAALRAELAELARLRTDYRSRAAAGRMDPDDVEAILRDFRRQENAIAQQLAAAADEPDPLDGFRGEASEARAAWQAAPLPRKRAVVQLLMESVVIERAGKGRRFDPDLITVTWRPQAGAAATA